MTPRDQTLLCLPSTVDKAGCGSPHQLLLSGVGLPSASVSTLPLLWTLLCLYLVNPVPDLAFSLPQCLSQGFYSCTNIMTKRQVGEERVYSAYTSTLLFITKGSQDRNSHRAGTWRQELMQRPWRDVTYWIASPGLLSLLSYRTQDYQLRVGTTHNGLGPPPLITN